jgi:SAM-dependent methyltransferase
MKSTKKNNNEISTYYKKTGVVKTYNARRFHGEGGEYIYSSEVDSIMELASLTSKNKKILDLGSGRGRLSIAMKERISNKIYCLEFSGAMVRELRKNFKESNIFHQSVFIPISKKIKFKTITSLRFFDHFNIFDQDRILKNMLQSLKKDGNIIMTLLNKNSLESKLSKFFPYGRYNFFYENHMYLELFKNRSLEVKIKKSVFFLPRGIFLYFQKIPFLVKTLILIDKFFSYLLPRYCSMHVVVLEKVKK